MARRRDRNSASQPTPTSTTRGATSKQAPVVAVSAVADLSTVAGTSVASSRSARINESGSFEEVAPQVDGTVTITAVSLCKILKRQYRLADGHFRRIVYDNTFKLGGHGFIQNLSDMAPEADAPAYIGVEASAYLSQMIFEIPAHEPLLAALGGDPIGLKYHIGNELSKWTENNLVPLFVFEGQSVVGKEEVALQNARAALLKTEAAWNKYAENKPEDAVKAFGASGAVRPQDLYRILQEVLSERNLDFLVAPFSACAQLAYLDSIDEGFIDGIMGSKELLLYNIHDCVINPPTADDWENKTFTGFSKSDIIDSLKVTPDVLSDALLMAGTSFLPTFPPLKNESIVAVQPYALIDAINFLRAGEKSVATTCNSFHDILEKQDPKWLDKYRKAKMLVKHCVTVDNKGFVSVRDYEHLTSDNIDYLGLQLPPELYHYLSTWLIGPRLLNSFVSLESIVLPSLDGVVSEEYKHLVTRELVKLKEETAALVASRVHRGIQYKDINMKFWFDEGLKIGLTHRNMHARLNQLTDAWSVKEADLKTQQNLLGISPGTISFATLALQNKEFVTSTLVKSKASPLDTQEEILTNVLWRMLHLRKFVSDQHELTSWGKALATSLKALAPEVKKWGQIHHIEEAAVLAFELIRFNNLNSGNRHPELIGGPLRGSDADKASCILIGRTACLLKLRHENIGYTGPLSKNFLAFHTLIKAVRETDRDLVEAVAASMFLSNQANRHQGEKIRTDFGKIGRSLPFLMDVDISLGIAVKTYLDDFIKLEWSAAQRESEKLDYVRKYLPHSKNFRTDLDIAFKFFDAIHKGVLTLGDEIKDEDKVAWANAKKYLDERR